MSDLSELSDFIDQNLNEFGSMGQMRLKRISKALQKKAKKGRLFKDGLSQNSSKSLYKMKDSTARMIKSKGGKVSFSRYKFSDDALSSALVQFADRSRDPEGRYTQGGNVTGVDDFRAAHMPVRRRLKKRVAGAATAAAVGVGGLYAATKGRGRGAFGAARSIKKVFGQ